MSQRNQGIIFIIISAFFFALMNLFVRLSGDVPVLQKCFFRNIVAVFVSFIFVVKTKNILHFEKKNWWFLLIRSVAGTLGIFGNFYALSHMNIADATILNKLSPFFALIFSFFLLKEKANKWEWGALVLAFIGALFVVKPSFTVEVIPALAGLGSGIGAGLAYTFVRKLSNNGVKGWLIVFAFSLFSCLVTLPVIIFSYYPMTNMQLLYLLLAGAAATVGQIFITKAYAKAPAKEISVFDYTTVLFAGILGFFVLEQLPDVLSIVGYIIVIGAAILKWIFNLLEDKKNREKQKEDKNLQKDLTKKE